LGDAGLLKTGDVSMFGAASPGAIVERMTWEGHEFLDNARNETVWKKVTAIVAAKGGSVSFEVLKSLVVETAKTYFLAGSLPTLPPQA